MNIFYTGDISLSGSINGAFYHHGGGGGGGGGSGRGGGVKAFFN